MTDLIARLEAAEERANNLEGALSEYLDAQQSHDALCLTSTGDALEDARERLSEADMGARAALLRAIQKGEADG